MDIDVLTVCGVIFLYDAVNTIITLPAFQDRENPLDNVLLYSLRRAGSVEMLDHSGDEDERRPSRKSSPQDASHHSILTSFLHTTFIAAFHLSLLTVAHSITITLFL